MPARRRRSGTSSQDELSRLLVRLRGDRTQHEAAGLVGITQSKVSRAERGAFPLDPDQAGQYARALGGDDEIVKRVQELASAKTAQHLRGRGSLVRSAHTIQERIDRLEESASVVRGWHPTELHAVFQTTAYTTAMLAGDGGGVASEDWWASWRRRAERPRMPSGPTWHLLISEFALHWPLGTRQLMADEIQHIAEVSALPTIRLGIVDSVTPKPMTPPSGFFLYDDHTVMVATEVGVSFVTEPDDVEHYVWLFEQLAAIAQHGEDAMETLKRVSRAYGRRLQTLPSST